MNVPTLPVTPTYAPLQLSVHLLVAVAIGFISLFTALAWPFAVLTGILIGSNDASRQRGEDTGAADTIANAILAAGGILAMLFFGAFVGGIIALGIVALAVFSERAAAFASPTDRGVSRILIFIIPVVMWLIVFPLLGLDVDITIGS